MISRPIRVDRAINLSGDKIGPHPVLSQAVRGRNVPASAPEAFQVTYKAVTVGYGPRPAPVSKRNLSFGSELIGSFADHRLFLTIQYTLCRIGVRDWARTFFVFENDQLNGKSYEILIKNEYSFSGIPKGSYLLLDIGSMIKLHL